MMLYKLLSGLDSSICQAKVISITDIGPVGEKIETLGVPVQALGMRRGVPNPLGILGLATWLRQDSPDVLQTWMYHADLIGGFAAKLAGGIPVIWGIRQSDVAPQGNKQSTIWTAKTCARLSSWLPTQIVCCSEASQRYHTALGYAADKMVLIPNGFELASFRPNPAARLLVRKELGIPAETILIGLVGRFDPRKDHRNFIEAAGKLHTRLPDVHFLLCGDSITWKNPELTQWIESAGIRNNCHLLGRRDDIPRLTAALDIATSSSYSEGFANAIGEAMACGVPCVVTDVGDSALLVGTTGKVVPCRNSQALAEAWCDSIEMGSQGRYLLGQKARHRIEQHFSLSAIIDRYQALYQQIVIS